MDAMEKKYNFRLRKDGSFRVLHLTDIQETMYPRKDTVRLLHALIEAADPDLIASSECAEPKWRCNGRQTAWNATASPLR